MNAEETLKKIASVVGLKLGEEGKKVEEVNLEETALEDGTKIRANAFEAGEACFVVTQDGDIPMPEGAYMTAEGETLVIDGAGLIKEIKKAEDPEGEGEGEGKKPETPELDADKGAPSPKKVIESITQETLYAEIEKVKAELKADFDTKLAEAIKERDEAVDAKSKLETQLSEITEAMKEPYTKNPPTHSPERKSSSAPEKFVFAQSRTMNTADRVMMKIANLKIN